MDMQVAFTSLGHYVTKIAVFQLRLIQIKYQYGLLGFVFASSTHGMVRQIVFEYFECYFTI